MSNKYKVVIPFKNHKPVVDEDYYGVYTPGEFDRIDPVFKLDCIGYDHVEVEDYNTFQEACDASKLFKARHI